MSELQDEYRGTVVLKVIQIEDSHKELMKEHMGDDKHGMLTFDPEGNIVGKIVGHKISKEEIVALLGKLTS